MPSEIDTRPLQSALTKAEAALQACGRDLQLLVTTDAGLEVVRRKATGEMVEPKVVVARLEGCDPLLWQPEQAGGAVMLGAPYREAEPRCVLSGQPLQRRAPLELYYRGQPVSPERALELAPLLVFVRAAVLAAGSGIEELGGWAGVENAELRAVLAERGIRELVGRMVWAAGDMAPAPVGPVGEGDRAAG